MRHSRLNKYFDVVPNNDNSELELKTDKTLDQRYKLYYDDKDTLANTGVVGKKLFLVITK